MKKIFAKEDILSIPTKEDLIKLTTKEDLVNAKQKLEENRKFFYQLFGKNEYDLRISYLNYKLSKIKDMEKENLKQELISRITEYVVGAIDNDFVEEEMFDVKEGVYIAPTADEEEPWYERGCEVTWKDSDCNEVKNASWTLDTFANDFGDLVENGRTFVEDIAKEIYNKIFEESLD